MKGNRQSKHSAANGWRQEAAVARARRGQVLDGRRTLRKNPLRATTSGWCEGKSPILAFAIKFGALMLVFYALAETPYCERVFWPVNMQANAWVANGVLRGLQQHTSVAGATIKTDHYELVIKRGCDATEPVCLLVAAVTAFRAPLRRKITGMLGGTLLLLAINQLRVVALFFVGRDLPGLYHTLHLTVFPAVFVVLALAIWAGWAQWTAGRSRLPADVKT